MVFPSSCFHTKLNGKAERVPEDGEATVNESVIYSLSFSP